MALLRKLTSQIEMESPDKTMLRHSRKLEHLDEDEIDLVKLKLTYGNTHHMMDQSTRHIAQRQNHHWTVFLKFDDFKLRGISDKTLIEKVRFGMLTDRFNSFISKLKTKFLNLTSFRKRKYDRICPRKVRL